MSFTSRINWEQEVPFLKELTKSGLTMVAIAEKYEVSKQRIKQIFAKYEIEQVGLKLKAQHHAEKYNKKWGQKEDSDLYRAHRAKYRSKKSRAKQEGKVFTVAFGELDFPAFCPILGIKIDYFAEGRQENSCSFDQIDPSAGYVKGNVQIISWRANRLKNDGSAEEHRKIADYLDKMGYSH